MNKWECIVCGYVYDPTQETTTQRLSRYAPEELPDDRVGPDCGVDKNMFEVVEG